VILHYGTANRESHPHAPGFRAVERLKNSGHDLRGKTDPRVFNRYLDLVRVNVTSGDHQFARVLIYSAHGFHSIHDQVQHDLLQLHPVAENMKKSSAKRVRIVTLFLFASSPTSARTSQMI
jgi:hypothetical protein